jgi:hypothetical protein
MAVPPYGLPDNNILSSMPDEPHTFIKLMMPENGIVSL